MPNTVERFFDVHKHCGGFFVIVFIYAKLVDNFNELLSSCSVQKVNGSSRNFGEITAVRFCSFIRSNT